MSPMPSLRAKGTTGLTQQNVNLKITSQKVVIGGTGEAEVVVRELVGVDSVDVDAKGLTAGLKYKVMAVSASSAQQVIGDFKADSAGKGKVNPNVQFFDAGYTSVTVITAG